MRSCEWPSSNINDVLIRRRDLGTSRPRQKTIWRHRRWPKIESSQAIVPLDILVSKTVRKYISVVLATQCVEFAWRPQQIHTWPMIRLWLLNSLLWCHLSSPGHIPILLNLTTWMSQKYFKNSPYVGASGCLSQKHGHCSRCYLCPMSNPFAHLKLQFHLKKFSQIFCLGVFSKILRTCSAVLKSKGVIPGGTHKPKGGESSIKAISSGPEGHFWGAFNTVTQKIPFKTVLQLLQQ